MVGDKFDAAKDKLKNYAEELGLSQDAIDTGYHLLDDFRKRDRDDFKPERMAAGALYMSAILVGEKKSQENIGKVANVSAHIVGRNYRQLRENVDISIVI